MRKPPRRPIIRARFPHIVNPDNPMDVARDHLNRLWAQGKWKGTASIGRIEGLTRLFILAYTDKAESWVKDFLQNKYPGFPVVIRRPDKKIEYFFDNPARPTEQIS